MISHAIASALRDISIEPKEVFLEGEAAKEIEKYAKDKRLDLLIVASHGHHRFDVSLLGTTTYKVVESLDIPILIIHND